ncbi:hypothetical protein BKA62DRAFT_632127 [Auriculariales sp. MPI-PUGE-AT-0066]|nr:hypothetical protein BKA62DRAFT_632127 [Auriculariales sp. MPI-PUGE-AT-0066]
MASSKGRKKLSVSEIARNTAHFQRWAHHHHHSAASMDDLPPDMLKQVERIFNTRGRLPYAVIDKTSDYHSALKLLSPDLLVFLEAAYSQDPGLFSSNSEPASHIYHDLTLVYEAWAQEMLMGSSNVIWSEADRANSVYSLIRKAGIRKNRLRHQCRLGLPKSRSSDKAKGADVLAARVAIPDAVLYLPRTQLEELWKNRDSPYNVLATHNSAIPFNHNSTPAAKAPQRQSFEFASSVWEDKKADHAGVEDAYRQNQMSTTALARHLRAFKVPAPVIGLVWAEGSVQAHVDWVERKSEKVSVFSARYSPPRADNRRISGASAASSSPDFAWNLKKEADILSVFLLVRNIDEWTSTKFRDLIIRKVTKFAQHVQEGKVEFAVWKTRPKGRWSNVSSIAVDDDDVAAEASDDDHADSPPSSPKRSNRKSVRKSIPAKVGTRKKIVTKSPPEENTHKRDASASAPLPSQRVLRARK